MINKNLLYKTRNKLIFFNTVVVGILFLVFSVFIYLYFEGVTYKNIDDKLLAQYEYVMGTSGNNSGNGNMNGYGYGNMNGHGKKHNQRNLDRGYILYVWKGNEIIDSYQNEFVEDVRPSSCMNDVDEGVTSYNYDGYNYREYKVVNGDYTIEIIKDIDTELLMLEQLKKVLFITVIMSLIISYIVSRFITRKSLEPVEASWQNQIQFVQDASHELRTPLTIISSKLEGIMKKPKNSVEEEMLNITIAMKEVRRLRKLVTDLLRLTKEDAIVTINNEKFDIVNLIEDTLVSYEDICQIQDKKLKFKHSLKNNIINNDKEKIRQVIVIFLDNAIKYTRPKDKIDVALEEDNYNIYIEIIDSGIGIKEEEVKNIFNRFYRSGSVREKNIEGSGVGLAIAKTILSNLNSDVGVISKLGEGSKFRISIPKK